MGTLRDGFLAALPLTNRPGYAALEGLEELLAEFVEAGRASHPRIELTPEKFAVQLARAVGQRAPEDALDAIIAPDLYLACACGHGDPEAIRVFRREAEPVMRAALSKLAQGDLLEEVLQQAMTKILVGEGEPAVFKYAGRGKLAAWARVTALRLGYDARRREQREALDPVEELFERAVLVERDPELEELKRTYREAFRRAFSTALEELAPRERTVLRFCYVDGLSIDDVGVLLGVHRATVARWRAKARESLFERTREIFRRDFDFDTRELGSVMRLIESQLSISLGGLEADDGDADPGRS